MHLSNEEEEAYIAVWRHIGYAVTIHSLPFIVDSGTGITWGSPLLDLRITMHPPRPLRVHLNSSPA